MLDLKSFVVNGELIIDKPHWYQLKNSHDIQELKDAISDTIDDLELPLVKYTEQEAKEDFEELVKFGVSAIIQPGGSINDRKVIKAANKAGIVMVFTGTRHFKH